MNEAHEVTLSQIEASFMSSPFDLVIGVELESTLQVEENDTLNAFTDAEWQVMYCRVLVEDRWYFLPQDLYDEVDEKYADRIGDEIWKLTVSL